MKKLLTIFLFSVITACSTYENNQVTRKVVNCTEPRPQVCTMDYQPVCGKIDESQMKTYSNSCAACSDYKVIAFTLHACQLDVLDKGSPKTK